MAKKQKDEVQEKKICKICNEQSDLAADLCVKCGAFLPDTLGIEALIATMGNKYKDFGTRVFRITDNPFYASPYPPISTGSLRLDRALVGGIPERSRVEIAGDAAAGKTTLALHICAQVTQKGGYVLYIDKENCVDLPYALRIGIVPSRFLIVNPNNGSEAIDLLLNFAPKMQLIVLDSVAACRSAASTGKEVKIVKGEVKDAATVGDLARLMSELEAKLESVVPRTRCTYLFINQLRYKISTMPGIPPSIVSPGGQAMTFMPTMKLWLRGAKDIVNSDGIIVGRTTNVMIKKAKHIGAKATVSLTLGNSGIDQMQETIDMAVEYGLLDKAGAWYSYRDDDDVTKDPVFKAQGEDQLKERLTELPHIYKELREKINAQVEEELRAARVQGPARVDEIIESGGDEFEVTEEEIKEFAQEEMEDAA